MTLDELSKNALDKKAELIHAREQWDTTSDELDRLCSEYIAAVERWHNAKYPGRKFHKPSASYLLRTL